MSKTILAIGVLLLLGATLYLTHPEQQDETATLFKQWAQKYKRVYENPINEKYRLRIFTENLARIQAFYESPIEKTYTLELNQFADMTDEEFEQIYLTAKVPESKRRTVQNVENLKWSAIDWTSKGKVPAVKNQASCGSCWAFSAIGNIEVNSRIWNDRSVNLSEQELVDCGGQTGNAGCSGGWMDWAFEYVKTQGIASGAAYPYTAKDGTCIRSAAREFQIKGYKDLPTCQDLLDTVNTAAVSVAVDASNWRFYAGGVFSDCAANLNHGVLVVGVDQNGNYKVRNSWGQAWGEQGYIWLGAGDTCGICQVASLATW
ncbi:hypothetical protein pb186bvf_013226 [Paramecium bursaria]